MPELFTWFKISRNPDALPAPTADFDFLIWLNKKWSRNIAFRRFQTSSDPITERSFDRFDVAQSARDAPGRRTDRLACFIECIGRLYRHCKSAFSAVHRDDFEFVFPCPTKNRRSVSGGFFHAGKRSATIHENVVVGFRIIDAMTV